MMGDKRKTVSAILGPRAEEERASSSNEAPDALHACAEEFISAVHAKDAAGVVSAFRAMFQELEAQPQDEGSEDPG